MTTPTLTAQRPDTKPSSSREVWLTRGTRILRRYFAARGYPLPAQIAVSIGWPDSKRAIGQCWYPSASKSGKTTTIFIGPTHNLGPDALDTLAHELVHAALGAGIGHGPRFRVACKVLGLTEGKPTNAHAGEPLLALLRRIANHLGDYQHDSLRGRSGPSGIGNGANWIKMMSPADPAYRIEVRPAAFYKYGPPMCPLTGQDMIPAVGRAPAMGE